MTVISPELYVRVNKRFYFKQKGIGETSIIVSKDIHNLEDIESNIVKKIIKVAFRGKSNSPEYILMEQKV
jgi:hypothetical protein